MSQKEWLPNGWVIAKVGDYLFLKNGFAFKSNSYVQPNDVTYPVIRISDIDGMYASDADAIHVSDPVVGFEVCKGDLLIAMSGATTGKIGVYKGKEPAFQNQRVGNLKLRSDKLGSTRFRNYLIASLSENILKEAYGGAQPNISGKAIENMEIQLPPLAEQKVIADKLDTLLAQVESIKARLERIPEILKQLRQSVLAAAVSGKLTEEWEGYDWQDMTIGEIAKVRTGKTPSRTEEKYWENGVIPWLTSSVTGSEYCFKADEFISELASKECNLKPFPVGTLLLAMYGEGKTRGQVTELKLEATCNQACAAIIPNNEIALTSFVKLKLQENYEAIRLAASGGNQPNLNLNKVREINIQVPTLEVQIKIVQEVEKLLTISEEVNQQVRSALDRVNNLTQSILAKAFRGELTAEWREANPELISGENSAKALLERIKAERASVKPATKRGRGKA
ncbi:restriction endonuclease subunit S [Acinetobacter baumannii]|uniref:restriction endonuclease subunit S n=1 Tax=Acinetobacter baumannii TaxID=470 RepID=UPI0011C4C876|nr:restriction endonuclease subunit S [Acinetobacter baumannii]MDC4448867.1 restriction endonuclease subunit S [Acinetobacter baumannii]MDC5578175.1 restriction endonuclease subunit S [Acinetobacter baumannii]MDO7188314.1 restriction endonuclease subunit S [Acinetobacter baumannii]MDV7640067.1 restriction endonuclease subunit S [Acinetobacter baumannii]NUG31502.1 restriction endonuclease subunit S [Acinetobacter baumannii]